MGQLQQRAGRRAAIFGGWTCLALCLPVAQSPSPRAPVTPTGDVDFVRDVQPIFASACLECHNATRRRGGLRLDSKRSVFQGGKSGPEIVAGRPDESVLMRRVQGLDGKQRMPLENDALDADELALLRAWIEQGAKWPDSASDDREQKHWAYVAPSRPALPEVKLKSWCANAIDAFILDQLEHEGLAPSPEADRATLIRRASLDLVGLPPSIAEVEAFERDTDPRAYEKVVDRLLASPRYGERWAQAWLDLARYADTNGYEKDLPRSLWPWRDWVIRALNADMPFDEFSVKQLAGDLLPDAGDDDRIATGFQRNTLLNDEGGIDKEEFRVVAVVDRVNTTATVWLGSTLACCQCHDHKFDPFTQREYYQFFAFFNSTEDVGAGNEPTLQVPSPEQKRQQEDLRANIAALAHELDIQASDPALLAWEARVRAGAGDVNSIPGLVRHVFADAARRPAGGFVDLGRELSFERGTSFSYGAFIRPAGGGCVLGKIDDPHAYRGFDLFLNNARLEVHIVHQWPMSGIKVETRALLPRDEGRHVFVTYDGSSKAAGVRIYVDGVAQEVNVVNDTLDGTIQNEVSLKLGAREASGIFDGAIDEVRLYERELSAEEVRCLFTQGLKALLDVDEAHRSERQRNSLREAFIAQSPALAAKRDALVGARAQLEKLPIPTTMVMKELSPPRATHVLQRGNFQSPGEEVSADVPAALHPFAAALPRNRLGLAKWLVDPNNPLVARVTMNRTWEAFFGSGLVATPEDFGTQGDPPTNAALLDWLATEFVARGWSQKALHKCIVMSSTYRQSSRVSPAMLEKDPLNHALGRAPRLRLDAERVRDNALAIGGLLSEKIGGPSVMPPQPDGIWADSFANFDTPDEKWVNAVGEDRWRRGLYTYLRRSAAYPSALTFDAPRRDVCVVRRSRSNTPLQALITLDDPVFVEAAIGLARRIVREPGADLAGRIRFGMKLCVARAPTTAELERLSGLYERAHERFVRDFAAATALTRQAFVDVTGLEPIELASWVVVANVLLNLDETITKG
jgi:mono/diheme cytochrome c family protein